ncbi:MAG: hypothetical protein Q9163_005233 [Psora crenata]
MVNFLRLQKPGRPLSVDCNYQGTISNLQESESICPPLTGQLSSAPLSSKTRNPQLRAHITTPTTESASMTEDRAEMDETDYCERLDEIIMAVDVSHKGDVGCCYYVAMEEKLLLLSEVSCGGLEVINTLKVHIQPTVVILSLRVPEDVEECFNPHSRTEIADTEEGKKLHHLDNVVLPLTPTIDNTFRLPYALEYRPSTEFAYEAGKTKLANLPISALKGLDGDFMTPGESENRNDCADGEEPGFTARQGKLLKLSATVDMESNLTIGCVGAVLTYLGRRRGFDSGTGDLNSKTSLRVSSVQMFSAKDLMFLNADTLASLQILHQESSPYTHSQGPSKGASGSKEGLSVYGLFHHLARTSQGKHLLRLYLLRPSLDLGLINERLDTISVFLRPDNDAPLRTVTKYLGQIKNMRTVMLLLRKGISNGISKGGLKSGVWSSIRSVFARFDTHSLAAIGRDVSRIVDFAASVEMHRTVVNPGVDEELDGMKRTYDGIEDLLNRTSHDIAATIPPQYSVELNVIFFPQIGFLISMPIAPDTGLPTYEGGLEDGLRWDRIFSTASRAYFKDWRMRELDDTLGDMYADICDREIEIVYDLGQRTLRQEAMLNNASDICGELDRHPLQELTVRSFVPNDTYLVGGCGDSALLPKSTDDTTTATQSTLASPPDAGPSMLMMTGPNYSGKSVYLKQIAIIVYMAHVGSFVPADRAIIGLTDKILTRIATRETVSRFQSSFMIDLQQVALAMTLATPRSLVIIDEFGKGTESTDGAGLACGVFEYFLELGDDRPKVLGATHFHEIFENGFLKPRPCLAFGYMEVRLDKDAQDVQDQITYLYNFISGRTSSSYGNHCAAISGVNPAIIKRSEELERMSARGENLVTACASVSEEEKEDLKLAEEVARDFLAQDLRGLVCEGSEDPSLQGPRKVLDQVSLVPPRPSSQPHTELTPWAKPGMPSIFSWPLIALGIISLGHAYAEKSIPANPPIGDRPRKADGDFSPSCYSAYEYSTLTSLAPSHVHPTEAPSESPRPSLPLDISFETIISVAFICVGLVLGAEELKPISWRIWAGGVEKEGAAGGGGGGPYQGLERRVGFVDIRAKRKEFADWAKSQKH